MPRLNPLHLTRDQRWDCQLCDLLDGGIAKSKKRLGFLEGESSMHVPLLQLQQSDQDVPQSLPKHKSGALLDMSVCRLAIGGFLVGSKLKV